MYKVLLVDDERYVLGSLASFNWKEHGFDVVGQAGNGMQALERIAELKPDLVFTDIRMPVMNGLELIQSATEKHPNLLFVAVSGYAEFEYAQKALNYGALGYCLKPFNKSEIAGILKKAVDIIENNRLLFSMSLTEILEDNTPEAWEKAKKLFRNMGFEYDGKDDIAVMVSTGTEKLKLPDSQKYIQVKIGTKKRLYFLPGYLIEDVKNHITGSMASFNDNIPGIGIIKSKFTQESVKNAINHALVAANQFFITGRFGIYDYAISNYGEVNCILQQLENAIESRDTVTIHKIIDSTKELSVKGDFTIRHALQIYNMLISYVYRKDFEKFTDYTFRYEQLTDMFRNVQDMLTYLRAMLVQSSRMELDNVSEDIRNETFRNLLKYVNENYCGDISVHSLSKTFNINPNYLSQLFKKELDVTFTDYLTTLRVSHAGSLLKATDLPVSEIAEKSGYEDYFYFTRVFKKITGMTPSEFRTNSRGC